MLAPLVAVLTANAFAAVGEIVLRPGGTVEIEGAPLVLKPLLYGNRWGYSGQPFGAKAPDRSGRPSPAHRRSFG